MIVADFKLRNQKEANFTMETSPVDLKILTIKTVYAALPKSEQILLLQDLMKLSDVATLIITDAEPQADKGRRTDEQVRFDFETWITASISNRCRIIERDYFEQCHEIYQVIRRCRAGGFLNQSNNDPTLKIYTVINGTSEKARPSPGSDLFNWMTKRSAAHVSIMASYPIGVCLSIDYRSLLRETLTNLQNIKVILFLLNCLADYRVPAALERFKELFPDYSPQNIYLTIDGERRLKDILKMYANVCHVYPEENMLLGDKRSKGQNPIMKQQPFYTYP